MLLSRGYNISGAAGWQEHQSEGRAAAEVSKEAYDALKQGRRASVTSRDSLTLPVVQNSPPGWVSVIPSLPLAKAVHTFFKDSIYRVLKSPWFNPKPTV